MDLLPAFAPPTPLPAVHAARALYKRAADAAAVIPALPEAAAARPAPIRPESLHPTLWLGHQLARHGDAAVASGFAALDAQLPGAGWPRRALTELLLPHPGVG
jgi:protein ImuA